MSKLYKAMGDIGNIYKDGDRYQGEVFQEYDDDGKTMFQVYRFDLDRLSLHKGMLMPYGFHKRGDLPHATHQYEEWFSKDLGSIAQTSGSTKGKLAKAFCSADPVKRFWAYYEVGSHHGFDNLDSSPLTMTELELKKHEKPTARGLHGRRYGYVRPGSRKRRR